MVEEENPHDLEADGFENQELNVVMTREIRIPKIPPDLAHKWLTWQCKMVAGIIRGAIYVPPEVGVLDPPITIWPKEGEGEEQLADVAHQVFIGKKDVVLSKYPYGPDNQRSCDLVACPLLIDKQLVGVVTLMISNRSESQLHTVLNLMKWGGLWMKTLVSQKMSAQQETGIFSLALSTAIIKDSSSHEAAMNMANQIADHFSCERVSIGFREDMPIRLQAISHLANFDERAQLVRRIESAMEEAVDQSTIINLPNTRKSASVVSMAHEELAAQDSGGSICTLPLPGRMGAIGAITLERGLNQPFKDNEVELCASLVSFIGPSLELKRLDERSFWSKSVEEFGKMADGLLGGAYLKLKISLGVILAILIMSALIKGDYQVTAQASIEGSVRQLLVAPHNAYVKESLATAGDLVKKDQLIALLDDSDLQLERQKWQSEINKIEKEYQEALAKHERTEVGIQDAKRNQIKAELLLVEEQIIRTKLIAPFDGVLVSGDLSQSLGVPVEKGQVLFEIAPLTSYRVVLEVEDRDISGLRTGKSGKLIIAALPMSIFNVSIDQVIPVAISKDEKNFFRVEAALDEQSELLLPGMRGIAKVEAGRKSLLWIWTHSMIDRIRLWFWSLG